MDQVRKNRTLSNFTQCPVVDLPAIYVSVAKNSTAPSGHLISASAAVAVAGLIIVESS